MGEIFGRAAPATPLPWTGERLTDDAGMQVQVEHLHRYFLAREAARGLDVLDVASGEGYGSAFLAQTARSVVGVDLDPASVAHANKSYRRDNLRFTTGDARRLPLPDAAFDLVVSFETLEHMREHDTFLAEVRRVLRPGGRLLLSTPERDTYSPSGAPANPFHVRELARAEFSGLLRRHFAHVELLGQRPMLGSAIFAEPPSEATGLLTFEQRGSDRFEVSPGLPRAVYLLAVASDAALEALPGSLYVHTSRVEEAAQQAATHLNEAHLAERETLERDLLGMRASLAALREDAQAAHAARAQAEATGAAALDKLAEAEAEREAALRTLAEAEAALRAAVARLKAIDTELRGTRAALSEAQSQSTHAQRAYEKAKAIVAEGAAYARHVEAELAVQRARGDMVERRLLAMLASSSWQALAPLQRYAELYPAFRHMLRTASVLLPWVRRAAQPATAPAAALPAPVAPPLTPSVAPPVPAAESDVAPPPDAKAALTADLRASMDRFLGTNERLDFRAGEAPDVSVLVVVHNQAHLTLHCLQMLRAQDGVAIELVLVDNASTDATAQLLERLDGARIIRNTENQGFLLATNAAAAAARGRTLLLLNNDAFLRPGALAAALATLDVEPRAGAVGARLILPSGVLQEAGSIVWADGSTHGYGRGLPPEAGVAMFRRDVDYVSGAFLLTPRSVWQRLGGFDEGYAPAYYEETDYCMRLREAGLRVIYEPAAAVDHYEFGSETKSGDGVAATKGNARLFRERHAATLRRDHLPPGKANLLAARDAAGGRDLRRLLVIDDLLPLEVNGAGLPRARAIVTSAVAEGWSVTHYPLQQPAVPWERLRHELHASVEVIDQRGVAGLASFLSERAGHYDAILVSRPHNMGLFRDALAGRPDLLGKARVIYDAEAIYALRDKAQAAMEGRPLPAEEAERRVAEEIRRNAAGVDAVLCVTHAEEELFRRHLPPGQAVHRLAHLPAARLTSRGHAARHGFLFVGRLMEPEAPNWQGLAWFLQSCWPLVRQALPGAELAVVGLLHPDHAALAAPGVRLVGPVEDLQPFYEAARVFVAPVQVGAGVSIKVIEAAAAGLPVVCTQLIARQLGWQEAGALAARDDPAALAAEAVALHGNAAAWQAMRERAQELLRRDFSAERFQDTLAAALGNPAELAAPAHRLARVEALWGKAPPSGQAAQWAAYPTSHPVIRAEMNRRATDRPDEDGVEGLRQLLLREGRLPAARAASLCCGTGGLERRLVQQGIVSHCIGYDLSAGAIEAARAEAIAAGLGASLDYRRCDMDTTDLGEIGLDLVIGCQGVHHIERLEFAFDNVHAALRPGGIFHLEQEFVGADRFQWPDRQIEEMTAWLRSLPERYRRTMDGLVKDAAGRASVADMLAHDPTEAPRSSMIEPLLAARFEIIRRRPLGGTLTMMALGGIAHNFDPEIPEDVAHLRRLLDREAALIASGEIGSDFVTVTARRS